MKLFPEFPYGYTSVIPADLPYGISSWNRFSGFPRLRIIGDGETNYEHFARENYRILKNNFRAYFHPLWPLSPSFPSPGACGVSME